MKEARQTIRTDLLVVGTGLAGLAFALKAAEKRDPTHERPILLLSKEKVTSANTPWAQGGIAAVFSPEDSFASHIQDTLTAGAGLCKKSVVENIITQAPDRIEDLMNWGVKFEMNPHSTIPELTREGGHSHRRILHLEDHTGLEIHRALLHACRNNPNICFLEDVFAIDVILNSDINVTSVGPKKCVGVYALDKTLGRVFSILAPVTILATGGAGKVYLYTSNWSGATGDGIAMAYRAGARVANLEFMQFHPTCLYHPLSRNFLITEAMRGEGAEIINKKGEAFLKKHHPLGSLAPRDIVAREIDLELKRSGEPCVFLTLPQKDKEVLRTRFPSIFNKCLEFGIEIWHQDIPVVPAAHYMCGGVLTDENGQTDILGLFALGETACTGLHGANRLASNSLLECLAMAHNCWQVLKQTQINLHENIHEPPAWKHRERRDDDEMIVIPYMWEEIRRLMWNYVGIVRSTKRLERAHNRLRNILSEVRDYYSQLQIHSDIIELRNISIVAELTVQCALWRKESRGIHFNIDYPKTLPTARDSIR